ncbi:hypothetical protein [Piscinibacter sp.]|jgi:hypothetical protein|uniref:hypothetical protein n=1 Tax=Piscinibacter sp. TaxID=1903157 RepID=UPI002F414B5B
MPQLTEQEWKRLLPLLKNIDINRQQAAYSRLVQGTTLVKAGEPFGYSMQDVHYIVKTVMRWWEKLNSLPDKPMPPRGWVAIELFVPRNHVDEVRRVVEALYPQPGADAKRKGSAPVRVSPAKERRQATTPRAQKSKTA